MDETSQKTWLRKGRSQESAWGIQFLLLRPSFSWDGAHFLPSSWCSAVLDFGWQTCWHHADLWLLLSRAYTQSRTCQLLMLPCQGRGLGVPMTEPGQLTQVTKGTFFYHFTMSLFIFFSKSHPLRQWVALIWSQGLLAVSNQRHFFTVNLRGDLSSSTELQTQAKHQDERILKSDNSFEQHPTDGTQISCTQAKPRGCYQQLSLIWEEINRFIILLSICCFTTEKDLQKFKGPVLELGKTNNVASIAAH